MKSILALLFLALVGCTTPVQTIYLMGGQKDTNMDISACWVQPPKSNLWYPCQSESVLDKECLNLYENLMKAVEDDKDVIKLWERTKKTCWFDNRLMNIPHHDIHPGH